MPASVAEDRSKAGQSVRQAFLKDDSIGKLLQLRYRSRTGPMRRLRVKLEVDTNPPAGASYEMSVLDYPFPSAVRIFDLPSLFAGKFHALLCRNDWIQAREDVRRFLQPREMPSLDVWSAEFFLAQCRKLAK
jgi:hypothetical protein